MSNRKTRRSEAAEAKRKTRKPYYDNEGNWVTPLSPEAIAVLEQLKQDFRAKFGRDPVGDEPLFFDPNKDTPQLRDETEFNNELLEALKQSGAPPAIVYTFQKTGRIVTKQNQHLLPPGALEEWNAALAEFAAL